VLVLGGLGFGDAGGNQRDRVFPRLRRGFEGVSDAAALVSKAELVGKVELAAEAELVGKAELVAKAELAAEAELVAEVELLNAKSPEVKLQPEGRFLFAATVGMNNQKFEVDLRLLKAEGAAAAGESAKSWAELAKDKLNVFASDAQEKTGETVGAAKDKTAESADAAHGHAKSYLELAKEKLHLTGAKAGETAGAAKDSAADATAKTYDTAGAAKDKTAESADAAQGQAKSYLELAKEKLNVFSKYVFKSAPDPSLVVS
jgi:hypothetical protein